MFSYLLDWNVFIFTRLKFNRRFEISNVHDGWK